MKNIVQLFVLLIATYTLAQTPNFKTEDLQIGTFVNGTLLQPTAVTNPPLAILIQGSGPTDRDGNQATLKNDALKKLAEELAGNGIASFRYDKRAAMEAELRFDDYVTDANSVLEHFSKLDKFTNIALIGHSQGSLVGMLVGRNGADAFISLAGAGQALDSILIEQIGRQAPTLKENLRVSFKEFRETGSTDSYNPLIASLFRPSVQPFLHSYIKYDPAKEIAKLEIPILILNGTRDLQISEEQAQLLFNASNNAELLLLKDMNHVLREIPIPDQNLQSYNEPERPLHPELVPSIVKFIKELE